MVIEIVIIKTTNNKSLTLPNVLRACSSDAVAGGKRMGEEVAEEIDEVRRKKRERPTDWNRRRSIDGLLLEDPLYLAMMCFTKAQIISTRSNVSIEVTLESLQLISQSTCFKLFWFMFHKIHVISTVSDLSILPASLTVKQIAHLHAVLSLTLVHRRHSAQFSEEGNGRYSVSDYSNPCHNYSIQ